LKDVELKDADVKAIRGKDNSMSHGKKTHAKSCMLLTQFFV